MNCPQTFLSDEIVKWPNETQLPCGAWVPARPIGLQGLFLRHRCRLAWRVFTGQYDVVKWIGDKEQP